MLSVPLFCISQQWSQSAAGLQLPDPILNTSIDETTQSQAELQ